MFRKIDISAVIVANLIFFSSLFCMEKCNKFIQEIKNARYSAAFLSPVSLGYLTEQREILVTGWQRATEEIARKDAEIADLQAQLRQPRIVRQQFQEVQQQNAQTIASLQARVNTIPGLEQQINQLTTDRDQNSQRASALEAQKVRLQRSLQTVENEAIQLRNLHQQDVRAIGELQARVNTIATLEQRIQELTLVNDASYKVLEVRGSELIQLRQRILIQQEFRNRIVSLLALLESSKATGWETAFVQSLKAELEK